MKLALVAGESSGDQLAAALIKGVRNANPAAQAYGIAGEAMQREGAVAWWSSQSLAVRGYFEPIKHLPRILKMRRELIERTVALRPDVFIGVDAPDFNLGVETKLRALLAEYGYSLPNVINLLDPQASRRAPVVDSKAGTRKPRQVKVYKNPRTGEVVETKGGNHKTLKEWKAEHGSVTVESWLTK